MRKLFILIAALLCVSCGDFLDTIMSGKTTFKFQIGGETKSSSIALEEAIDKLHMMLFDLNGNKVLSKIVTQTTSSDNFGSISLDLDEGDYLLVAVGHSSPASATIESPTKISFTLKDGVKITDTFTAYSTVTITKDKKTYSVVLERKTAMVRFIYTDTLPEDVAKFKFKYTGGSASIDPSGYGNTKSTQTETRAVNSDNIYEIFTFPYGSNSCLLNVTADALDKYDNVLKTVTYSKVPVETGFISEYKGSFFNGTTGSSNFTFGFYIDSDWKGTNTYTF